VAAHDFEVEVKSGPESRPLPYSLMSVW